MTEPENNIDTLLKELDQDKIKVWFNALKQQPLPTAIDFFEHFSKRLLEVVEDPAIILKTTETIRPIIYQLDGLSDKLPAEQRTASHLRILNLESAIYEHLLNMAPQVPEAILPQAVHRCLATQIQIQLTHYEHYLPIPEKEWLLIHRLFFLSVQNKIAGFITADNIHFLGRKRSIANLYNLSLLLGCGRLNHLTPAQIRAAGKSLQDWCTLISISRQPSSTSDNQLVVDITSGSAPHFKKLFTSSANSVSCYLQVDKLIDTLDRLLPDEKSGDSKPAAASFGLEESTLDKNLIVHLRSAWSEYIYREIREETEEPLMVCTGFYNVHYHLCGGKTLKDFIGEKVSLSILYEEDEDIATIEKQRSTDVWSAFTTIPDGDLVFGEIPAEFNFQHFFPFNAEQADNDAFPETRVVMTDRSTKGCCLQWPQNTTDNIEVGELIGLRKDNKHHLQIGEIAWKDLQEDGRFRTGIHILSSKAIPIAVDVPLSAGSNQNFAEAILLPAEEALGTQCTSFLSRPDYYKKGNYLSISQKGIEEKVHLSETVTDNAYFARFDCGFILKKPVIGIDRSTR